MFGERIEDVILEFELGDINEVWVYLNYDYFLKIELSICIVIIRFRKFWDMFYFKVYMIMVDNNFFKDICECGSCGSLV